MEFGRPLSGASEAPDRGRAVAAGPSFVARGASEFPAVVVAAAIGNAIGEATLKVSTNSYLTSV